MSNTKNLPLPPPQKKKSAQNFKKRNFVKQIFFNHSKNNFIFSLKIPQNYLYETIPKLHKQTQRIAFNYLKSTF